MKNFFYVHFNYQTTGSKNTNRTNEVIIKKRHKCIKEIFKKEQIRSTINFIYFSHKSQYKLKVTSLHNLNCKRWYPCILGPSLLIEQLFTKLIVATTTIINLPREVMYILTKMYNN